MRLDAGLFAALLAAVPVTSAAAPDFVQTEGPLTDDAFYALVACGAAPGKGCSDRLVRWPARRATALGIGLASMAEGYPMDLASELSVGLDRAIAEINGAGAGVRLVRATRSSEADISIHLVGARQGRPIRGTGNRDLDGIEIEAALVNIRWNLAGQITRGTIALASDLPLDEAYPILLEEVTQSLGLMTDIRNPYYDDVSVFSEDSNTVTRLSAQDIQAIRRHYPAP